MRVLGAGLLLTALACSRAPADFDAQQLAIINGHDDRLQAFEVPAETRAPLLGASAALVFAHHLREESDDSVLLRAPDASAAFGLCDGEAYASEPVAAFCSAVLIDDDLVATAGHCFGGDLEVAAHRCRSVRVVFGYALSASDAPLELRAERVFACRNVVALDHEFAIVQLDRTATEPSAPRPIATASVRVGDALVVASHGAGLPLKVELAADVTEIAQDSGALTLATDTFSGSSGGGVYNQALELVGLVENGAPDWEAVEGCNRAAHAEVAQERAVDAHHLTKVVCDAGWPSLHLCNRPPMCGDGTCNGSEASSCQEDCPAPRCGDWLCEQGERGACPEDCARYADVPQSWLDDPEKFPRPRDSASPSLAAANGCSLSAGGNAALPPAWLAVLLLFSFGAHRRRERRTLR
ncbi:MAG TPA: serine protease [Polyangiaceae bacterium]|nr:serine protease [Polyangiaceae bacterium]